MSHKFGFPGMVKRAGSGTTNTPTNNKKPFIVRVTDIILDENHPLIKNGSYGINSIGLVICKGTTPNNLDREYRALPSNPNNKAFPTLNEHLQISQATVPNSNGIQFFYDKPLGLYGSASPNGNFFPSTTQNISPPSQNLNYSQTELGAPNVVDNSPQEISISSQVNPSQATFVEKGDIHPLMPFEGDILYEGRWGNSIRFGSTAPSNSQWKNNWSEIGGNGDPILIFRNGQPKLSSSYPGYLPITENLNEDLSSLYLTSYQKIPFSIAREDFKSKKWKNPPLLPSEYANPQIITNSDRIVINAKEDSVLISAKKSVGISCYEELNLIGKDIVLDGQTVYLGSKDATQPVLKGDDTVSLLREALTALRNLAIALEPTQTYPNGVPTPNIAVQMSAKTANNILSSAIKQLDTLKSSIVKTK